MSDIRSKGEETFSVQSCAPAGSRGSARSRRGQLRIRTSIAAVVAVVSSLGLLAPAAQAAGSVCYSAQVTVNGGDFVNEAACHDLPEETDRGSRKEKGPPEGALLFLSCPVAAAFLERVREVPVRNAVRSKPTVGLGQRTTGRVRLVHTEPD